jgi:hypothetical protein
MKRVLWALPLVVLFGMTTTAQATPVAYKESVSGDLGALPPFTQFTLDVGANTVSGTSHDFATNGDIDSDSFAFAVPAGMQLVDISYSFVMTPLAGTTESTALTAFILENGNGGSTIASSSINLLGASPVIEFGSSLPLGPGTYSLFNASFTSTSISGWTSDYTWTLDVRGAATPVPEPASMVLLGGGLVGVGARRWRNRGQRR